MVYPSHPSYQEIAESIVDDARWTLAREIREAMEGARLDGAAALGGMLGMAWAIRDWHVRQNMEHVMNRLRCAYEALAPYEDDEEYWENEPPPGCMGDPDP